METHSTIVKPNGGADTSVIGSFPPVTTPPVTAPRPSVDPHSLAHKAMSKAVRAVLGAEILDGRIPLMNPTIGMVAQAAGVSASYVAAARRLSPDQRQAVARGLRPLVARRAATSALSVEQRLRMIVSELGIGGTLEALAALEKVA